MTSPSNLRVFAVIPAFNEAATIASVVSDVRPHVAGVILVSDRSTDETASLAAQAGAIVVSHEKNTGYDGSVNDGFKEAVKQGADVIITLDADGQHDPSDISRIVAPILTDEADVVVSERKGHTHAGEMIFSWYTTVRFGIKDPLSGMKAYRRNVYEQIGHFDTLKSIGTQMMVEAWLAGFRVKSVSITVRARQDVSRFYAQTLRGNARILKAMWKIMKLSMKPRLH